MRVISNNKMSIFNFKPGDVIIRINSEYTRRDNSYSFEYPGIWGRKIKIISIDKINKIVKYYTSNINGDHWEGYIFVFEKIELENGWDKNWVLA
jgi:hypothetical protein